MNVRYEGRRSGSIAESQESKEDKAVSRKPLSNHQRLEKKEGWTVDKKYINKVLKEGCTPADHDS